MNGTTHYDVLRVTRDAPPEVIRAAYKALSQKWHPDRNPSPEAGALMQVINDAYAVLSDPSRRADYDRTLHTTSAERPGFGANPQAADRHTASANATSPRRRQGPAFEVDWDAVSRAQREQNRRHRVFGRDSLISAARAFGLLFGAIFLLHLLTSHG
ncbi:Heat shock protein DnaJ-like protein [Burkholderia pseudomallei]|nr:Heat shock protein DnaJ-like protein [Burkholderia pseudomallei]CAJ5537418.1 Heat shock protein DnaJ-like protein [Burkholderia pseudomallei]CAJ7426307.1 Heat shock protein DnaJ-like protein [Burkholderia pseudomallei]CAJ7819040.1 Heat shock protein DnaJ-like protein [Burkholderia pseudomallei]